MAGWNKNIKSPTPPVEMQKDIRLVSPEKKVKEYPSELKRMTTKVFRQTDNTVTMLKEKNRYLKIEIYEKAVSLYQMVDEIIPEFSGISKKQTIAKLLSNLDKFEEASTLYDMVAEELPELTDEERRETLRNLLSKSKRA